ncbi:MAG: DUF6240 domain-containing protein, partial [Blautia sp.]|nr:DUF6240 domain-containing protein [Blautia sp.]
DISGTVMDNKAYKGQGKTAEDVMQEAGQIDAAVWKDYMTVMSNSMSAEDFGQMLEDGCQPGDMEIEEVVTIIDTIKAELMKGGVQIEGYTDQIDEETLREITGSETFARELWKQFKEHDIPVTEENVRQTEKAYEKASELQEMTEGAVKYMVENHMEPTIDNLYRADYSSTVDGDKQGRGYYAEGFVKDGFSGYYAKKAEEYNWQQLRPQMERVLEEAGLEINEETLENARWLIEKGVPLTPESAARLHELDALSFPQDEEQILSSIAAAIADGKSAGEANLADGRSNLEKAAEYVERFERISEQAADKAEAEGKELTLSRLETAQKQIEEAQDSAAVYEYPEAVTARRQLEEIRLMMTIEANRKLLESGYAIDTTGLEKLVEALKQIEEQQKQRLFGGEDIEEASEKAALYEETRNRVSEIPYLPVDVAGRFQASDEDFTLKQVHTEGSALKNEYEEAREKYEALMTAPRADMGDSIRKAFRNVDDILQDMGLEPNEENRRAVRILGYNRMELTPENIQAVKESDMELRRVIEKMTPQAALQTIRDGKNPLEMTIPELNDYLDTLPYTAEQETEKYSRFLYKLDKNKGIDIKEREAYIGIYRMFRQIEKADDAAVGTLLHNGAELSFKNLLSAVRSSKKQGMDFAIDEFFGGIDAVEKNVSITEQIESGFGRYCRGLAGETADRMAEQEEEIRAGYRNEQLQEYRQLGEVEEAVVTELLNYKQPISMNHLFAADMLMNRRGSLYKKLDEFTKPADKEKVKNAVSHLQEAMTDKEAAQEAYGEMQQAFEEVLEEARNDAGISYIDLKAVRSCRKQLALAGSLAKEENYQIPVEINGETTAIHLKVLHGTEEGGKVKAALSTEGYGDVAAEFSIRNQKLSGYIACATPEGTARIQDGEEQLRAAFQEHMEAFAQNKLEIGSIGIVHSGGLDLNGFMAEEPSDGVPAQTADLYQAAKAFITAITA